MRVVGFKNQTAEGGKMKSLHQRDLIAEANDIGSSARTIKGALRALVKFKHSNRSIPVKFNRAAAIALYGKELDERKSNPEAKRSLKDKAFRKNFLRQLKRTETTARKYVKTAEGIQLYIQAKSVNQSVINKVNSARAILGMDKIVNMPPAKKLDGVCLIPIDAGIAKRHGVKVSKRGKDWQVLPGFRTRLEYTPAETKWDNGKPVSYTRAQNDNFVQSYAVIIDPSTIEYQCAGKTHTIKLPDGYQWAKDENLQLFIFDVNNHDADYHPDARDILQGTTFMISELVKNVQKRKALKLRQAFEKGDTEVLKDIVVRLQDSFDAGNCKQGTVAFCQARGLKLNGAYPAIELVKIEPNHQRLKLAISSAIERHVIDMNRGYCQI